MDKTLYDFPNRLKGLRSKLGYTQTDLAKKLSITRASVNAWEMGLSAPSATFLVELSRIFSVTTDFLLGLEDCITIRTEGLSDKEVSVILNTIETFKETHTKTE